MNLGKLGFKNLLFSYMYIDIIKRFSIVFSAAIFKAIFSLYIKKMRGMVTSVKQLLCCPGICIVILEMQIVK